jgi:hypothetical protein
LAVGTELRRSVTDLLTDPELELPLQHLPVLGASGYVVKGWSHLIAGYGRTGKTELLLQVVKVWVESGLRVLWITEEPARMWRERLQSFGHLSDGLGFIFGLCLDPDELLRQAVSGLDDLVIVDSIRNILAFQDENSNSEVAAKVNPWIAAHRDASKTLLMIHHSRKGGGSGGEGIAGASSLLSAVDIAVELTRDASHPLRRLLKTYSRVLEPRESVYERRPDGHFEMLGDPSGLRADDVRRRVAEVCDDGKWRTGAEVIGQLEEPRPSPEATRQALLWLAEAGRLERDPELSAGAKRGTVHRWRLRPEWELADSIRDQKFSSHQQSLIPGNWELGLEPGCDRPGCDRPGYPDPSPPDPEEPGEKGRPHDVDAAGWRTGANIPSTWRDGTPYHLPGSEPDGLGPVTGADLGRALDALLSGPDGGSPA